MCRPVLVALMFIPVQAAGTVNAGEIVAILLAVLLGVGGVAYCMKRGARKREMSFGGMTYQLTPKYTLQVNAGGAHQYLTQT